MTDEQADQILKELEMLRKLKIFELFEKGYSQGQLAQVLGVSQPTISRMVPKVPGSKRAGGNG
jgi:predicted transcriptional regulator